MNLQFLSITRLQRKYLTLQRNAFLMHNLILTQIVQVVEASGLNNNLLTQAQLQFLIQRFKKIFCVEVLAFVYFISVYANS